MRKPFKITKISKWSALRIKETLERDKELDWDWVAMTIQTAVNAQMMPWRKDSRRVRILAENV